MCVYSEGNFISGLFNHLFSQRLFNVGLKMSDNQLIGFSLKVGQPFHVIPILKFFLARTKFVF